MSENLFTNVDLAQLGKYFEEQQGLMVTESEESMLGAGITKFRLCGVGFMDLYPGFELWLDSDIVNTIAAGGSAGAAISALIPDPTVSKVIAAFLGTIGATFSYAAAKGTGIFIRAALLPVAPFVTPIKICYQ